MAEKKKIATGYIGNALRSAADNHITTFADEIFDTERQKYQNEVNTDLDTTDSEIKANLEAETIRAKAAEQANAQAIEREFNERVAETSSLQYKTEKINREDVVGDLGDAFVIESDSGDVVLSVDENGLNAKNIKSNGVEILPAVSTNTQAITNETARAKAAEQANAQAITDEATRATKREDLLEKDIIFNTQGIENERELDSSQRIQVATDDGVVMADFSEEAADLTERIQVATDDGVVMADFSEEAADLTERIQVATDDGVVMADFSEEGIKAAKYMDLEGNNIIKEPEITPITVACWGDSITAGTTSPNYPQWLQTLLGDNYTVHNLGCGSAWLQDISARFGGVLARLANDITVPADTSEFEMPYNSVYNKYETSGFKLAPRYNMNNAMKAFNPVIMGEEEFIFRFYYEDDVKLAIKRVNEGSEMTLKKGTFIIPFSTKSYSKMDCTVIFMGTNNFASYNVNFTGESDSWITYKNYHDDCIKELPNTNYIILGLFNISQRIYNRPSSSEVTDEEILTQQVAYETHMEETYTYHFVNLRRLFSSNKALDDAVRLGYLTAEERATNETNDNEWLAKGCAAYSLMSYKNGDYTHPNLVGYKMIAYYVAQRIKNN